MGPAVTRGETPRPRGVGGDGDPLRMAANAVRFVHHRPEFCDELRPRAVETEDGGAVVCDGCTDPDNGGRFEDPPIVWRDDGGVVL